MVMRENINKTERENVIKTELNSGLTAVKRWPYSYFKVVFLKAGVHMKLNEILRVLKKG